MKAAFSGAFDGKRVLVTGHTGFKGSWLSLWLTELGADVVGVALDPPSEPSHFAACAIAGRLTDRRVDIRDYEALAACFAHEQPEIVFHLAAQPLVRRAFLAPRETFEVNVMGTVNVLEAARRCGSVTSIVVATSDKAYRNVGWDWPYRETDPLGGHEPYAGSKAGAEIVVEVYRQQRFQANAVPPSAVAIASARAGNVIGGGDWAEDRLVPDVMRAIAAGREVTIRNPDSVRPWQHVLDCLAGYLQLAARLGAEPRQFAESWNFGPGDGAPLPVVEVVRRLLAGWPGHGTALNVSRDQSAREAQVLRVDSSKAIRHLGWRPTWQTDEAIARTIDWHRLHAGGADAEAMQAFSIAQIASYTEAAHHLALPWAAP